MESTLQANGMEDDDRIEKVWKLIAKMNSPSPAVFKKHYVEGKTAKEIGEEMEIPRNTVLSYLRRGMIMLRNQFTEVSR